MAAENHSQIASFISSICNLLHGPYKHIRDLDTDAQSKLF